MKHSFRSGWLTGWVALLLLLSGSASAAEDAGKILFGGPGSYIVDALGIQREARRGEPVRTGDTLVTKGSRIQVAFSDGGMTSVLPDSEFKVSEYHFGGKADGTEKGTFDLVKGGLHTVTGAIGKGQNQDAYRLKTSVATMGIRGTEYVVRTGNSIEGYVIAGAVVVKNKAGQIRIGVGAGFYVASLTSLPVLRDAPPPIEGAPPPPAKPKNPVAEGSQATADILKQGVDQGMTIDQVVQAMVQDSPEKAEEIVQAALDLTKQLPYGSCDQCNCGGGDITRQYPVQDLESFDKKDWVKEVEKRYFRGQWEAMPRLRKPDASNPAMYFYTFNANREQLAPYLQANDQPPQSEIERYRKLLEKKGFPEPLKLRLNDMKKEAYLREGRALMDAAGQLGIDEFPVLFGFTECIVCGGNSASDHYTIPRLRETPDLRFVAPRFFQDGEYLLADRQYPKTKDPKYGFDYHAEMKIEELLEYFDGEPNQDIKDQWKKELQEKGLAGALNKPMEIALHHKYGYKKDLNEVRKRMKEQHEELLRRLKEKGVAELLADLKKLPPNPKAKAFWLDRLQNPGAPLSTEQQNGIAGSLRKEVLALLAAAQELGQSRIDPAAFGVLQPIAKNYLEPDTRALWLKEMNGGGLKFFATSHELLVAAQELGIQVLPVNLSFLDEMACQAGIQRTVFPATELLEDDRMKTVADRFFDYGRRLVLDEDGRRREERLGYPFGPKIFNYHMMVKVEDLLQYLKPDHKPDEALIKELERELVEKGVVRPIYMSLLQDKKETTFLDQSEAMIIAAQRLGMVDRLPVRVIYLKHLRQNTKFCEAMIRKAANLPKREVPPKVPPQAASPS